MGQANFELEKRLVNDTIQKLTIGPSATQVAVISYSGFAVVNFRLDNFTTRERVQQAVSEVKYFNVPGIGSYSHKATGLAIFYSYPDLLQLP